MRILIPLLLLFSPVTNAQVVYLNQWETEQDILDAFDEPVFKSISEDSVIRMIFSRAVEPTTIYRIQRIKGRIIFIIKTESERDFNDSYLDLTKLNQQEIERLRTVSYRPRNSLDSVAYRKALLQDTIDFNYTEQIFELGNEDWDNIFKLTNSEFYRLPSESHKAGSDGFSWSFKVRTSIGEHQLRRWAPGPVSDPLVHKLGSRIEVLIFNTLQLSGTIRDQNNEPIKNAIIKIVEPALILKSYRNGEFKINFPLILLTTDQLELETSKKNYQTIKQTISVGDLPTNLNIELIGKKSIPHNRVDAPPE